MDQHAPVSRRSFIAGAGAAGAAAVAVSASAALAATPGAEHASANNAVSDDTPAIDYLAWVGEPPVIADDQISQTVEADIVVVGGGNAGVMCACAAAEEGATVAVIESQPKDGIFYYGLHDIASVNSNFVLERGVEPIKKSTFIAEYQRRNMNRTDPRLVKKFVDNSGEMVDWLVANSPAEVADAVYIHNQDTNNAYFANGADTNGFKCWRGSVQVNFNGAAATLVEQAESQGATWYWETTGVVLVTEEADNGKTRVTGVIAQGPDGTYTKFVAGKGVVLACGDYGANPAMYAALQDEQRALYQAHGLSTEGMTCAMFGRDGSGIKMGMWAGGSIDPVTRTLVSPQVMFMSEKYPTNLLRWGAGFQGGQNPWGSPFMWVDESGRRFTDETFMGIFGQLMRAERMKPGAYYAVFDSTYADQIDAMAPEHFGMPIGDGDYFDFDGTFAGWLERGAEGGEMDENGEVCAWGAQSLEDLFDYMGLSDEQKAAFAAEIEKYNGYCEAGDDEDFGRDPKTLFPVSTPPFFAIKSVEEKPMVGTCTLNGLVIDENQAVLDKDYDPIEGLYATGNNSGGRFAVQYTTPMPGLTLGMAMTLGRVLGKELAAK